MLATKSDYLVSIAPGHAANADTVLTEQNTVAKVAWKSHSVQVTTFWSTEDGLPETEINVTLQGIVKLAVPTTALFTSFVINGLTFTLENPRGAGTTAFNFTYAGTKSVAYVQSLLVPGARIAFSS